MIFIGTMEWATTRMKGMFACPNCGTTETFRLRASRPFLTIYFIPLIPIGGLEEFVQCTRCKNSFEPDVLTTRMTASSLKPKINGAPRQVPFEEDLLKVIALMMVEDGHVTDEEIRIARRLYENITEQNISREDLGRMCSHVRLQRLNTQSFLATAGPRRNHEEKLLLVQAMFGVAGAEGAITEGRLRSLSQSRETLQLDPTEFQQAVASTDQWLA